jgi:hypothetical protein
MHGPYRARVLIGSEALDLSGDDVREGVEIASGFYQDPGPGTLDGFTRAATFTAGLLLDRGDRAEVEIIGRDGPESGSIPCQASSRGGSHEGCYWCEGTGRLRARDVSARSVSVVRVDDATISTSLGSRWGRMRSFRSRRILDATRASAGSAS